MTVLPRNRAAAVLAATLVAGVAAGCGNNSGGGSGTMGAQASTAAAPAAPSGAPVASATVDIRSFKYKPPTVVLKKGGRVKWVNADAAAHTSTADDRSFDTQTIDRGKAKMVTFTAAGTFPYHCDFHPFMKGTIVVK